MKTKKISMLAILLAVIVNFAYGVPPSLNLSTQLDPISIYSLDSKRIPTESILTLTLTGVGELERPPIEIVLAIDSSGSMKENDPKGNRIDAAEEFLQLLDSSRDKSGLVSWDDNIDFVESLTDNFVYISSKLDKIDSDGGTNLDEGLNVSIDLLADESSAKKIILFLSDGSGSYIPSGTAGSQADRAKDQNIKIYPIGLNIKDVDAKGILEEIANATGGKYYDAQNSSSLEKIYEDIGISLINFSGKDVELKYSLPSSLVISNYSIEPNNVTSDGNEIEIGWLLGTIPVGDIKNISFNVSSNNSGSYKLGSRSAVDFEKMDGTRCSQKFEEKILEVSANTEQSPFKSGASVVLENTSIDFPALYELLTISYDPVESDEIHIVGDYRGANKFRAFIFADGRVAVASPVDFNLSTKDNLVNALNDVIDLLNAANTGISDEMRNRVLEDVAFYAYGNEIYHKIRNNFSQSFLYTLSVPDCTIMEARMQISGRDGWIQRYKIDGQEVASCQAEANPAIFSGDWNRLSCELGWQWFNVTDKIFSGLRSISAEEIEQSHTMVIEITTSSQPPNEFILYGPKYVPLINETGNSETIDNLNLFIWGKKSS